MSTVLHIVQILLAVLITGAVLLQAQGAGLGQTWSGGGETYHTRRGVEKFVFYLTIVAVGLFICTSVLNLMS